MVEESALRADQSLRLAELLTALSVVTDLGIGRPPETAMGACLLASRLGAEMRVSGVEANDIYYTTLLRYIGCTAYAHEEAALAGGDELAARSETARTDYRNLREAFSTHLHLGVGAPPLRRAVVAVTSLPRTIWASHDLTVSHCEVGMAMARRLAMDDAVREALGQIFERWDGNGFPSRLKGEALSLPVRVAHVATQVMAFLPDGYETAEAMVRQRSGGWFDPAIAAAFLRSGRTLIAGIAECDPWQAAVEAEPEPRRRLGEAALDDLAAAFADMTDLKTTFTRGHSSAVADLAQGAARRVGLPPTEVTTLRRAALFHDLGRVAVANGIWEKEGSLSAIEWEKVRLHPYHTERILARAPALQRLAPIAGMHHERQDGSGYFRSVQGSSIPMAARLLGAADAYEAMTKGRLHRPALDPDGAARALEAEARAGRLDADAVRAVLDVAGHRQSRARPVNPAGLSAREVEVLRLIATGATYRDVARILYISPRTAAHHVQHIYDKIGVSTRAAAAMFAMEHHLL